jgi:chloramphenicol 3-O-phosphotransferase
MRNHRVVEHPMAVHEHDHVSWSGPRMRDFTRLATAVFDAARDERLVFVGTDRDVDQLRNNAHLDRLFDFGTLTAQSLDEVYGDVANFDPAQQFEMFSGVVDDALRDGYRGVRVVADTTPMVTDDDDAFARWLTWEQMADRLIATRPLVGVCYFDDTHVDAGRLEVLAALHPVTHGRDVPPFRFFMDDGVAVIIGEIDEETIATLRTALAARPRHGDDVVVDVGRARFIDHRTLHEFARWASTSAPVRVRGVHPTLRRLWDTLDFESDDLVFI